MTFSLVQVSFFISSEMGMVITLFLVMCDIPVLSEHEEDSFTVYNQKAVEAWERIGIEEESLVSIEEAWVHEEVGYIYQKADNSETAMDFYKKAWAYYREAYTIDVTATETNQVDGD